MDKKLFEAKLNMLSFADLEALKRLKSEEIADMINAVSDEQDKNDFINELNQFNPIIKRVIANKISQLECDTNSYSN